MSRIKKEKNYCNASLKVIDWFIAILIGLVFFIIIYAGYVLFTTEEIGDKSRILSGVLIGFSALLATSTFLKTFYNTNRLEEQRTRRDLFDRSYSFYNKLIDFYSNILIRNEITNDDLKYLKEQKRLAPYLFKKEVYDHIQRLEQLCNISFEYQEFSKGKMNSIDFKYAKVLPPGASTEYANIENKKIKSSIKQKKEDIRNLFEEYLNIRS